MPKAKNMHLARSECGCCLHEVCFGRRLADDKVFLFCPACGSAGTELPEEDGFAPASCRQTTEDIAPDGWELATDALVLSSPFSELLGNLLPQGYLDAFGPTQ